MDIVGELVLRREEGSRRQFSEKDGKAEMRLLDLKDHCECFTKENNCFFFFPEKIMLNVLLKRYQKRKGVHRIC